MPTLALSMIVKNAEANLARCLESVRGVADEIVVADTGSTDRTAAIARQHGAVVFGIPWEKDFAKARNRSLAKVRSEWVLWMDADEMLDPDAGKLMPAHISTEHVMGYSVTIRNYVESLDWYLWDQKARPNHNAPSFARQYAGYFDHTNLRLFRRHPDVCFEGCVHESVYPGILRMGMQMADAKFLIHHFGFTDSVEIRAEKSAFYRELGREKLREMPENPMAYYELAFEESQRFQDYAAALPLYQRSCELNPRFGPAWLFYGKSLGKLGRYREALEALERAGETNVQMAAVLEARGDVHYSLADFEETERCYRQVIDLEGESPQIESKMGFTEVRLGRPEAGLGRLRRAIELEPSNGDLHDRLIGAYAWLGKTEAAAPAAEYKLEAAKPQQPESFLRAASLHVQLRNWPRAIELLRTGLDCFPKDEKLRDALAEATTRYAIFETESQGDARFRAFDFEGACQFYQRAIDRLGILPSLESKLGLAKVRLGQMQEGFGHLRQAVNREPASIENHDRLISAYAIFGNFQEAAEAAEKKLAAIEPRPEFFLRAASLRAQMRDWPRAAALLSMGLEMFPADDKLLRAASEVRNLRTSTSGLSD
jgi:tetratricopeptide (TPR) repeat protein